MVCNKKLQDLVPLHKFDEVVTIRRPQKSLWIANRRGGINPARFSFISTILTLSQSRILSLKTIVVVYYMDKAKVDEGIERLIKALPERPEWVVIVDRSGKFITRIGHYTWRYGLQVTDEIATTWTHTLGMHQLESLDKLNHGNLQYSMSFGSDYALFLFNLNDAYFISLCYDGVKSFDAIIEGFLRSFQLVTEPLWYS